MRKIILLFCVCALKFSVAQTVLLGLTTYGGENYGGTAIFITDSAGNNIHFLKEITSNIVTTTGGTPYGPEAMFAWHSNLCRTSAGRYFGVAHTSTVVLHDFIYEFDPATNDIKRVAYFTGSATPTGMTEGIDGKLYGFTGYADEMYSFNPATLTITNMFMALGGTAYPAHPTASSNGLIYGISTWGGGGSAGEFFQFDPITHTFTLRHVFAGMVTNPKGHLVEAPNGRIYGVASNTLFEWDPVAGAMHYIDTLSGLRSIDLCLGNEGKLYGFTNDGTMFTYDPDSAVFNNVFTMGIGGDGELFMASNNKLYGETPGGVNGRGTLCEYDLASGSTTVKANFPNPFPLISAGGSSANYLIQVPCTPSAIVTQPQDSVVSCSGASALFWVKATGTFVPYQWQLNTGSGWNNITGSAYYGESIGDTLRLSSVADSMNHYQYRCIVGGVCSGYDTSGVGELIVLPKPFAQITSPIPVVPNNYFCAGDSMTFHAYATANASFQWYNTLGGATAIAGETDTVFTTTTPGSYFIETTDVLTGCSNRSSSVYIGTPLFTGIYHPTSQSVCAGADAFFVAKISGAPYTAIIKHWEINTGSGWQVAVDTGSITGASTDTIRINPVDTYMNGYRFRRIASNLCSLADTSHEALLTVPVPLMLGINVTPSPYFCSGDTVVVSKTIPTSPSAGTTYWYHNGSLIPGSTDSNAINAVDTGNYYFTFVTSPGGCYQYSTPVILIEQLDCDVWPGDANNDLLVDNYDLLPLGLYYGSIGNSRPDGISNLWQAWSSFDWGILQSSGQDIKQADCNGDGIIDDNDTLAINQNFSSIHSVIAPANDQHTPFPPIFLSSLSGGVHPGDFVNLEVDLGNSSQPINGIYGIAFDLNFESALVEPGTTSMQFPASWIGDPGVDLLKFSNIDMLSGLIQASTVRDDHFNKNGYGSIATINFQVRPDLSTTDTIHFNFLSVFAIDSVGTQIDLNPLSFQVPILSTVGIGEIANSKTPVVYPNPVAAGGDFYFTADEPIGSIQILDAQGQLMKDFNTSRSNKFKCSTSDLIPGVYVIKIETTTNLYHLRLVIQ